MLGPPYTASKLIILALLAAILWTYLIWQIRDRWRQHRRRREVTPETGLRPEGRPRNRRWLLIGGIIVIILLVIGIPICIEQFGRLQAQTRLASIESHFNRFMAYVGVVLMSLVAILLMLLVLLRDKSVTLAAKLALAGKHAEAEQLIRETIRSKGETERRLTVLGLLLMDQNRLDESLVQFEAARRLAKHPGTAMNNCAMALWKLGRRDEALKLFEEACQREPSNFTAVCNCCLLFAELGRQTEAYERLEQAERIYERYDPKYLKNWTPLLERCRQAAPTARGFPVTLTDANLENPATLGEPLPPA
jgi:tetratricopeptide (TPR) repeat protein